jgi:hypothetical protein
MKMKGLAGAQLGASALLRRWSFPGKNRGSISGTATLAHESPVVDLENASVTTTAQAELSTSYHMTSAKNGRISPASLHMREAASMSKVTASSDQGLRMGQHGVGTLEPLGGSFSRALGADRGFFTQSSMCLGWVALVSVLLTFS